MLTNKKRNRSRLWMYFTLIVLLTVLIGFFLVTFAWWLLSKTDLVTAVHMQRKFPLVAVIIGSAIIGVIIALFVGKLFIKPIENISNAINELSKGNFDVRVTENERIKEISRMTRSFNKMAYSLSQVETLQNDFVTNVSHEFKTPIASIEGYATLLQDGNLPQATRERYLAKIIYNSRKLSDLSENILLLSKIENQQGQPSKKSFRLDEQIRKCILSLENKWTQKNITFDLKLQSISYFGSELLLERVWCNIIDNAIKHSYDGSEIHISVFEAKGSVIVAIADEGEGMSEEVQKHIFDKFYQGDKSHTAEGNGLGLALVKRIVEICFGEVRVKSEVDEGAEFTVILPKTNKGKWEERVSEF